ncbi:hypothetical protein STAS_22093 [Striga asiatica]|uniref:SOSEKI DIX-like domain-containing protein n=1 Tax=Striga asiatica TaxID=4170 RepID=A0A5A7QJZ7_STRAF|nr:hypothetical protein STAS_22093 [Striga asiatica]
MEAQNVAEASRVLHIVYFLSRKGYEEHPHLIRVEHLSKNGVQLRDIKRWLGELRGKDMPKSFAWSYKRRYKTGYVWQDLLDDDLITPISDNEYVLQGSEIPCTVTNTTDLLHQEITKEKTEQKPSTDHLETKLEREKNISNTTNDQSEANPPNKFITTAKKIDEKGMTRFSMSLRSLLSCRGTETKESSVMIARGKPNRPPFLSICSGQTCENVRPVCHSYHRTITEKPRGTQHRISSNTRKIYERAKEMPTYKPLNGPNCAQCGKIFKPEKMHAHMKSCRGVMSKTVHNKANFNRAIFFSSYDENKSKMANMMIKK